MRHIEGGPELGQPVLYFFGSLPVAFGGGRDAKRTQQIRRGCARVPGFTEHRMQTLAGEMMKDEINDAPGVEGLFGHWLVAVCHAPRKLPSRKSSGLNMRQAAATWGLLCNGRVNPKPIWPG